MRVIEGKAKVLHVWFGNVCFSRSHHINSVAQCEMKVCRKVGSKLCYVMALAIFDSWDSLLEKKSLKRFTTTKT